MLAGVLCMVFIVLGSQIIEQGVQVRQKRQALVVLLNGLDSWSLEVREGGFLSPSLEPGAHQQDFLTPQERTHLLHWNVQELTAFSKGITFQTHVPHSAFHYQWKTGILFAP